MPSPIALTSAHRQESIFKKRSPSYITAMRSAQSYLIALSEADARARSRDSGSTSSAPTFSLTSSTTTSSQGTVTPDDPYDNSDGLAYPITPPTSEQIVFADHLQFGFCANESYRYKAAHKPGTPFIEQLEQDPPYYILLTTYLSYLFLICVGHIRDFFGKRFYPAFYRHLLPFDGYAPLNSDFDSFYTRRLKERMDDCFSAPVTGVPGRTIMLLDREREGYQYPFYPTGTKTRALNISSYNYLGFANSTGGCADAVEECIRLYGVSTCGARLEGGSSELHVTAEALVARFVGQEDALISSMGFATNSTIIPALVSKGCLLISDELNHASIRVGARLSSANVRMFKHNNMESLESLLREVISQGQPKTHRPWKKILLVVEGLYSMEGTLVNLPKIMELKKKYKFCLFVDEAHSIGAMGPNGRGVADYFGINPQSIDILMGTFTKSFGAAGGYVAGSKALIDRLRLRGHGSVYAESMTPPVLTQILASTASIMGVSSPSTLELTQHHPGPADPSQLPAWLDLPPSLRDGSEGRMRLRRLAFNARYLTRGLGKLGFITYGHTDSPIVPLLVFNPGKMSAFSRMMRARKTPVVVVVVAYPATPLITSRVRFCVSASHTKDDIDTILRGCDEIGDVLDLKHLPGERWSLERIMNNATELVNMEDN
ncbi:pyridoxal phosphate-dependent transferase [Russula earlei]|uniref:Pyridoxal phosphate-dependent transferase n=1 Tax=Russula earlei TaxID=71964 RepID=A0ACC0U8T5_9AGAM|nr:pyridoxal phosphate-dependent transferase [Russula earlei]